MSSNDQPQVSNLTGIAAIIQGHFKINCTKNDIQRWKRWNPPFPVPTAANRYNVQECLDWVEANIMPSRSSGDEQMSLMKEAEIADAKKKITAAKIINREWEVLDGKYIERTAARRLAVGTVAKLRGFITAELERNDTDARRQHLVALGVSAEIVAKFQEFDAGLARATINRIADRCEQEASEADALRI